MSIEVEGLKRTEKALKAKIRYVIKSTSKMVMPTTIVSKSLAVARDKLTKTPGKPKYPLRWKSRKQQIAVIMKLREAGNLPYSRTGKIQRGWKSEIEPGKVIIANEAKDPITGQFYANYVFGKDQQPFHKDTGWNQADAEIVREIVQPISDSVLDTFVKGLVKAL